MFFYIFDMYNFLFFKKQNYYCNSYILFFLFKFSEFNYKIFYIINNFIIFYIIKFIKNIMNFYKFKDSFFSNVVIF